MSARSAFAVLALIPLQFVAGSALAEGRLQGTWRVQVNPVNCLTGAPLPSFPVLLSFARGGILTEVMGSPAFQPGQRTAGLGVWSRSDRDTYKAVWDAFILFDSAVFKRGVQRLTWDFELDGEQMTFASTAQFYDISGNPLQATCASGTGTRFEKLRDADLARTR